MSFPFLSFQKIEDTLFHCRYKLTAQNWAVKQYLFLSLQILSAPHNMWSSFFLWPNGNNIATNFYNHVNLTTTKYRWVYFFIFTLDKIIKCINLTVRHNSTSGFNPNYELHSSGFDPLHLIINSKRVGTIFRTWWE